MAGVALLLRFLSAGALEFREDGVTDRFGSTFLFLAGGAFLVVVAMPFFAFDGAGRFFGTVGSGVDISVD